MTIKIMVQDWLKEKVASIKEAIKTDVEFPNYAAVVRSTENSSKSINPTTYNRYNVVDKNGKLKYHSLPRVEMFVPPEGT